MFLLINSVILLLPVAAVALLKLYDSTLIRQTENALISQAVMLSNIYKKTLFTKYPELQLAEYGRTQEVYNWKEDDPALGKWRPIPAVLDLHDQPLLPVAENPREVSEEPDPIAWHIGQELEDLLRETQVTTLAGMRILDTDGVIVATTGWIRKRSLIDREDVANALTGRTERVLRQREEDTEGSFFSPISRSTEIRVYVTHPIIAQKRVLGAVHLVRTPPNLYQTLHKQRELFLYYGLLIIIITITLSLFTSYAVNKPIRALVQQARQVTSDRRSRLAPLKNPIAVEIEELSSSLVTMADRQAKRAEQIQNFASYVSHEFKTPITSINGALEILRDFENTLSADERSSFLTSIENASSRMQMLMGQLTELAKADTTAIPAQPVELEKILLRKSKQYEPSFKKILINRKGTSFPVYMNVELIDSVIENLFENANMHGGDEIEITLAQKVDSTQLTFMDNGPGISPANSKRIFEPFFTTAKKNGGTGLGLAILSTLMNAHQGSIALASSINGCKFELTFPALTHYSNK